MNSKKNSVGAPTTYKSEYCEKLIEHMSNGYSYESFAGVISSSRAVLYKWEKAHPEFVDAKKKAIDKCLLFWEKIGIENLFGVKGSYFNVGIWVFNMKNRFGWSDSKNILISNDSEKVNKLKLAYAIEENSESDKKE